MDESSIVPMCVKLCIYSSNPAYVVEDVIDLEKEFHLDSIGIKLLMIVNAMLILGLCSYACYMSKRLQHRSRIF